MKDSRVDEILSRVQRKITLILMELNIVIERAIARAQNLRQLIIEQVASGARDGNFSAGGYARYPQSEYEIMERQRNRMIRFYNSIRLGRSSNRRIGS